jgi:hypothetical protein
VLKCSSCGEPAEWACTAPSERYFVTAVSKINAGDRICRMNELEPKRGSHAIVVEVRGRNSGWDKLYITITIYRADKPDRQKSFYCSPQARYRVAKAASCGRPLCENCAQQPGDPHRYCPEHWLGRMEVAA